MTNQEKQAGKLRVLFATDQGSQLLRSPDLSLWYDWVVLEHPSREEILDAILPVTFQAVLFDGYTLNRLGVGILRSLTSAGPGRTIVTMVLGNTAPNEHDDRLLLMEYGKSLDCVIEEPFTAEVVRIYLRRLCLSNTSP